MNNKIKDLLLNYGHGGFTSPTPEYIKEKLTGELIVTLEKFDKLINDTLEKVYHEDLKQEDKINILKDALYTIQLNVKKYTDINYPFIQVNEGNNRKEEMK